MRRMGVAIPGSHVGVADGLDLLDPVLFGDPVERAEAFVEIAYQFLRAERFTHRGKAFEIGE